MVGDTVKVTINYYLEVVYVLLIDTKIVYLRLLQI